ncbi:hypothetical protein P4U65_14730 [Bacillus pacificus]|nr:hypothetical protein [Bacillus pacificus]
MELVKVYLDLNSQTANSLLSSMHLSADSHRTQGIRTWHRPAPPTYVMGSTMPVGFSRSREANRTPNSTIPGLGTRYVDQKIDETKEEYKVRKKKESVKLDMQVGIGSIIYILTVWFLLKLAVTIFGPLW